MADLKHLNAETSGGQVVKLIDDYHAANQDDGFRAHFGASVIGRECERAGWYGFHWSSRVQFDGRMLRLFRRGHNEEFSFIDDLRAIGVDYHPENPETGKQWRYSILNGHVGGSCDGLGRGQGLPEIGDEPFVGEFKTHSKKSFSKFFTAAAVKADSTLAVAKPEHYAQCQLYMGWQKFRFALYLAVCKDDDRLYSEVIKFDPIAFAQLQEKAERILRSPVPPAKISDKPDFYLCRFCDHSETCHGEKSAVMNCRTCIASTANLEGAPWTCSQGYEIDDARQRIGCADHRYIPDLVPVGTPVEADEIARSITYEIIATDGSTERFVNGRREDGHYTSRELELMTRDQILDDGINLLRGKFDGEVIGAERIPADERFEFTDEDIPF